MPSRPLNAIANKASCAVPDRTSPIGACASKAADAIPDGNIAATTTIIVHKAGLRRAPPINSP
jgi:hypothetical protein